MLWERKPTKKLNIYQLLITQNPTVSIFEHCLINSVNYHEDGLTLKAETHNKNWHLLVVYNGILNND